MKEQMSHSVDTTYRAHELHMPTQVLLNFVLVMHNKASAIMPRATMESCLLSTVHSTALDADVVCAGQPGWSQQAAAAKHHASRPYKPIVVQQCVS